MGETAVIQFEIEHTREHAGWLPCALLQGDQRFPLTASNVLPPFGNLRRWLRAVACQRLPHEFFWDEEGPGAYFEALPLAPDSDTFRLRLVYSGINLSGLDVICDRRVFVADWLETLQRFADQTILSPERWEVERDDLAAIARLLAQPVPSRAVDQIAGPLQIRIERPYGELSDAANFELTCLGLGVSQPILHGNRFWPHWLAWLERVARGQWPARLWVPNQELIDFLRENPEWLRHQPDAYHREPGFTLVAEPATTRSDLMRLKWLSTSYRAVDFPLLDERVDRRRFVVDSCAEFERYVRDEYRPREDGAEVALDLRTWSPAAILAAMSAE